MVAERTQLTFGEALQEILLERGLSLRELSRLLGVDPTYMSRVRRGQKRLSADLPTRVAIALGLPEDYFLETRETLILEAIRKDPGLREEVYRRVSEARPQVKRRQ
jgi:transcriptional regulator with XRE-family HTH domain